MYSKMWFSEQLGAVCWGVIRENASVLRGLWNARGGRQRGNEIPSKAVVLLQYSRRWRNSCGVENFNDYSY